MARKMNSSLRFALIIFVVGSIIPFSVGYFTNRTQSSYNNNLPYISLGDNIKNKTTKGHLWFEEFMAGDTSIDFKRDVLGLFEGSKAILVTAQNEGETELGYFSKSYDKELMNILFKAERHLVELIDFTNLRHVNKLKRDAEQKAKRNTWQAQPSSISATDSSSTQVAQEAMTAMPGDESTGEEAGGGLDQAFDEAYEKVQADMDEAIAYVNEKVKSENSTIKWYSYVLIFCILVLTSLLCYFLYRSQRRANDLTVANEEKLKYEVERLGKINEFVVAISNSNFDAELITDKEDTLAVTLTEMKNRLKANADDEQRRSWSNIGLAKIGEILRNSSINQADDFYNNIISFTAKYIDANQSSLFILNDDTKGHSFLELKATYAYNKKRYVEKTIEIGEGLVGQCFIEKEYIFLTEVPDKYTFITSGLGEATPHCLMLVPLKVNEEVTGILEIASFKVYQQYEIDFILKLAENIAASISSYRINIKTASLLEQTQQQAEEMMAQEEEMRQNMEELKATQEEMQRVNHDKTEEIERLRRELQNKS